jgi:demethylmenaquinone methyltransferase/2-methoxy-6-polyprenyl-1,4-benzoquinol methylase
MHYRWRAIAASKLELSTGDSVLDLCCGTGSFIRSLRRLVGNDGAVIGIDFCMPMIGVAARRSPRQAQYVLGDALALPLPNESLDGVTVGWGIRNLADVDGGHREIYRVLKSGKRFASVDMAQPTNPIVLAISRSLFMKAVPTLGALFGKKQAYQYLTESTERFKTRAELVKSMTEAGFVEVGWQNLMFGNICIHWGLKP